MNYSEHLFAPLEERVLLAAQPVVAIGGDTAPLIGEQTQIDITFSNQPDGSPGSDTGYAPYVDLILPQNGADGAGVGSTPPNQNDGVTFVAATYLGQQVAATVLEFDANGQAVHPFAKDASGNLRVVNAADYGAAAGDQLVVLRLPFGSFVADQPAANIQVTVQVSELADVGVSLPVSAVGGFAYGRDPSNNPTVDPPVLGTSVSTSLTPTVLRFDKVYDGPEGETTTGPNFPRSFTINLDIATGQLLTDASILDTLPDGIVVVGTPVLAGLPGTAAYDPLTHTVTATLGGPVTGVAGVDGTLTINFYVGEFMAPGDPTTPVLDPQTGAPRTLENNVSAQIDWTPIDGRDPPGTIVIDEPGPEAVFVARSIATQKTQAVLIDTNAAGLGPGDTLRYTIDVQISDYFEFQNLTLDDLLSDGQSYVNGSATLAVVEGGSTAGSGAFAVPNIIVTRDPATGATTFRFLVSDQLVANGAPDGLLTGGEFAGSPTTLRITYDTVVESFFLATGHPVVQGDTLSNSVSVGAEVVDGGIPTGNIPGDTSSSGATIATGAISKEIYAINGNLIAPSTAVEIGAGDLVTFRLSYSMPQSLADDLVITDYLPLPIFDVSGLALTIDGTVDASVPGENIIKWGPDAADFALLLTQTPILSRDLANNTFTIEFLNLHPVTAVATTADILFTVRVVDQPFGDGLQMTNQVRAVELTDAGEVLAEGTAIRQLTLTEPELRITKGVVATDNASGVFSPGATGPVSFSAPGSAGVRFAGTIDSTNLAAVPINSNLLRIDAGDLVTFAIVVENRGSGINGAFDIRLDDNHPTGYVIPDSGLNLQVTDGAGNLLPYVLSLGTSGASLTLTDPPGSSTGALTPFSPTGGANIVVITYDLRVGDLVEATASIPNLAEIDSYAAVEGGVDRVPTTTEQVSDTAAITIAVPQFNKNIIATSLPETGDGMGVVGVPDLNVGETITFELVVTLHEGRIRNLVVEDRLPLLPGRLDFVSAEVVSIGANLFEGDGTGLIRNLGLPPPVITNVGNVVLFTFANDILNVPDNVVSDADRIVVRVTAVAADVPGNQPGVDLENVGIARFTVGTQPISVTDTATAEMVGPAFNLTKVADVELVQGNDIVTYTVTFSPLVSLTAGPLFDAILTDPLLPGLLTLVAGSAIIVQGPAGGATISEAGGIVTVTAPVIMPGETISITYQALVDPSVLAGSVLPNTVTGRSDSYPGTNPLGVEREYTASATESVRVPGPGVTKTVSVADTSLPETGSSRFDSSRVDLAIGEIVTYRIVVVLPEAVTQIVTFEDFLPIPGGTPANEGLFEFLSADLVRVGANISGLAPGVPVIGDRNGDGINDFIRVVVGTLTNTPDGVVDANDEVEVTVTARVRDAAVNRAGQAPVNLTVVTFDSGGVTSSVSATATVDIVEPTMVVNKSSSSSSGDGGDIVVYRIAFGVSGFQDGPAYDVVLTDTIPVGMDIDLASLAFASPVPIGTTLAYDAGTRLITVTVPVMTFESSAIVLGYRTIVANTVHPDEVLLNTASVVFDSHPGDPGDEYQRNYGPVQDIATFTIDRPLVSKVISSTDIPETNILQLSPVITDVAIGETVRYLVRVQMPAVTTDLVLTDLLPVAQGADPLTGDMEWISSRIVSLGANLRFTPGISIGNPGVISDRNGDGVLDTVVWDLGQVTNIADNVISQEDFIVVEVVGRVLNRPTNQPADQLTNVGQLEYTRADGSVGVLSNSATVEIVSPELIVAKTPDITTGDAGDIVTYTVAITHDQIASTADAYQLVVTDLLAPGLQLIAGSVTVSLTNSVGSFVIRSGNNPGDTSVDVALSQLSNAIPVFSDGVLTISYQARLMETVRQGDVLTNTAAVTWQSAPAGFPQARPDAASDDASVTVVFPVAIDKSVVATSLPETASGFFDPTLPDLAIGETATYEVRVTLGEGTQQVLVQDTLPAGLVFVSGTVVSIGAGISNTAIGIGAAPVVSGGLVTFDFGNAVVNAGDNLLDDGDVIVLQIVARAAPGVSAAGDTLTNNATFTSDGGALTDAAPVEVVKPDPVITKTASVVSGDAGDLVTFTVEIAQNAGASAPLYDLFIQDILPVGYVLVAGSASATRGTVTETGGDTVQLTLGGAALLPVDDPATPGVDEARIFLTYSARLADTVRPGDVVTNTVTFTGTSAPGGGPTAEDYTGQDDASVTVILPLAFDKSIIATSLPETTSAFFDPTVPDLAIGETATYEIRIRLGEGTQQVLVQDTLPTGLVFVSGTVVSIGASISNTAIGVGAAPVVSGGLVTFDFGNAVVNTGDDVLDDGDVIVLHVTARAAPGVSAAGDTLTNNATFTTDSGVLTDAAPVEVVKPDPVITKVSSVASGDAGDLVTFTVEIAQNVGASGPLYDLFVQDILPVGYVLVAGSASATRGSVVEVGGTTIQVTLGGAALLPVDDPATPGIDEARILVTYSARLADSVEPGQVITNTATFAGASAPGGGPTTEAYSGQDDAQVTVAMPVALDKQIVATSLPESTENQFDPALTDLAVGETVTYHLTATLSEGTQTLVITDTLPAGLEVLSTRVVALGAGVSAGAPAITVTGQLVTFDFATVVNTGNNDVTDGTVTVEIIARVQDVPGNVAGTALTNAGTVTIASPTDPLAPGGTEQDADSVTVEVVEPALVIDKVAPPGFVSAGETIAYGVTLTHAPGSTAAAYDIVVEDLLTDPNLELVAGTVVTSAGTVVLGNGTGDTTMRIEVPVLALGQTLTVTFTARVAANAPGGVTLTNTVTDTFDSAGGAGGRPDGGSDSTQTPGAPAQTKAIVATSNPDTGTGQFDPTLIDLEIGEELTYQITVVLPQGTTDNLVLSDIFPSVLQPLAARVVSIGGGLTTGAPSIVISGQTVTFVFGTVVNSSDATVGAEDTITLEIDGLVVDDAAFIAGDLIVNAARMDFTIAGRDGTLQTQAEAELVEPQLNIAKNVDVLSGDAGLLLTYTVTISHAAGSTAASYDMLVTDLLDARFVPVGITTTLGTASFVGNEARLEVPRFLTTDAPITLTYQVRFADSVEPGQVIGNTATLVWDSDPVAGGRPGTAQSSAADVTVVLGLDLAKSIVATSLPETGSDRFDPTLPDLAVGEIVTYELVATLSEGTQHLVITDTIPLGLLPLAGQAFVVSTGGSIAAGPGGILTPTAVISGQQVTFDFGTIVNTGDNVTDAGDQVTIRISARVLDVPFNLNGRRVENGAEATISSPSAPGVPGGTVTDTDSAAAEIVVPRFLLDKAVDHVSGDAGDVFTYTLVLSPAAGTDAPAFNILIEDPLSPFLALVPGSLTSSMGTVTTVGNMIRVEIPTMLPDAAPVIITYRAAFTDAIEPGQVVPNLATLDYASAPTTGRNLADDAEASVRGDFALALTKQIVATSLPETGTQYFDPSLPDIAAGETVTFHLTATLSEGTQRLVIADTLPPGLIAESARLVSLGAGISANAPAILLQDGRVVFDFGTVVNAGDNVGGDQVVVEIVARLNPVPPAGAQLLNTATAEVTAPTDPAAPGGTLVAADAAAAEAVAAVLVFDKQVAPTTVGLMEPITYTLTLSHAPNSTAPAYEVVLWDPLSDASLELIAGSVTVSGGTVVQGNGPGDTGIRVTIPVLLPGQVLTVTFQARAVGIPIPDGIAPNTATFDSTSAPGAVPPGFTRPLAGQDTAQVQVASAAPPEDGGSLLAEYEDAFRRIAQNTIPLPTVLSGTATPGAAVTLNLVGADGGPITIVGLTADTGGNWMANPIPDSAGPRPAREADPSVLSLAGRERAPVSASLLPDPGDRPILVSTNTSPYTVMASESGMAFDVRAALEGTRVTFGGALQPGGMFVSNPDSPGIPPAALIADQLQRDRAALAAPVSLAWNRFALDFAAASATAGLVGR